MLKLLEPLLALLETIVVELLLIERDVFLSAKVTCVSQLCFFAHLVDVDESWGGRVGQLFLQAICVVPD